MNAHHSELAAKRILAVEGVRRADFTEMRRELRIIYLPHTEMVAMGIGPDWPESRRRPGAESITSPSRSRDRAVNEHSDTVLRFGQNLECLHWKFTTDLLVRLWLGFVGLSSGDGMIR
jgi:hypothetical protein